MGRRTTISMLGIVVVLGLSMSAGAQPLQPGGLTALPEYLAGADRVQNGGFEVPAGSGAANWSLPSGWAIDPVVRRSGVASARMTGPAATAGQTLTLDAGFYRLSAWVRTQDLGLNDANAGVRLTLDYRPGLNEWVPSRVLRGTQDWTFVEVPFAVPARRTVTVKLETYRGPTGRAWFDDVRLEPRLLPLDAFLLGPNYRGMLFDDQPPVLRFDLRVTPPAGALADYRVELALREVGAPATLPPLARSEYPAQARFEGVLDGTLMEPGTAYEATATLRDAAGAVVYAYPAFRVSRVPAAQRAQMNVSFDDRNRVLLRGEPRFILGVYDSGLGYSTSEAFWDDALFSPTGARRLNGLRINLYLNYWMGEAPAAAMNALMSSLQRRGVGYLQTGNCFDTFPASTDFPIHASDAYVADIGAHPGSLGYYTADECKVALMPSVFEQYRRLRALDPDSMTFAALFGDNELVQWRDAADVLATDPYPLAFDEPAGGYDHGRVAEWTARAREVVQDARPFFTVLQFFRLGSTGRWPTRAEMRNHAYMAVVEGAAGLLWWSVGNGAGALAAVCSTWCAERTAHMEDLKAVVDELADLEPVLLADDEPAALAAVSGPMRTRVKVVDGLGFIIAYNTTGGPATATFTWRSAPRSVGVLGEDRTLATAGAAFSDAFGPFQARVYVVDAGDGGGTPGNTPPVAAPVAVTLDEDTPAPLTLRATDAEQCQLQFTIVTPPSHGTLGAIANRPCTPGSPATDEAVVTYTPAAGFSGTDSFTYAVSDGTAQGEPVTVSLTVRPVSDDAPAAPTAYVATLAFESRVGKAHDERVVLTVRQAPAGDQARPSDPVLAKAAVTVEIRDGAGSLVRKFKGTTNGKGLVRSPWLRKLPPGTYTATVTSLAHKALPWSDALGQRQAVHNLPH